jgi:hypothetical protein
VHIVARLPRVRKIDIARAGINFSLSTRHEIAAGILRLRPSPVEPTPVSRSIFASGRRLIRKAAAMTSDRNDRTGFAPHRCEHRHGRRSTAFAQLITSAALALSIAVAAAAVSMGIARADGVVAVAKDASANIAVASVLVMVVIAAGLAIAVKRSSVRSKADE